MKILKWKIELGPTKQTLMLPAGATSLDLQMIGNDCCLWALCKEDAPLRPVQFRSYWTGEALHDHPGKYIGTVQNDGLVWHIFQEQL